MDDFCTTVAWDKKKYLKERESALNCMNGSLPRLPTNTLPKFNMWNVLFLIGKEAGSSSNQPPFFRGRGLLNFGFVRRVIFSTFRGFGGVRLTPHYIWGPIKQWSNISRFLSSSPDVERWLSSAFFLRSRSSKIKFCVIPPSTWWSKETLTPPWN